MIATYTIELPREQMIPDILRRAKEGDNKAREALIGWAYETASSYYLAKVDVETHLTRPDAEDLAGAFIVEFHRAWPRVSTVCHYTRRMLRNNLNRYLKRKKTRLLREAPFGVFSYPLHVADTDTSRYEYQADGWSDEDRLRQIAVTRVLATCDPVTRRLMILRAAEAGHSYRQIALILGPSESALRMRATRFYRLVREEYGRLNGTCTLEAFDTASVRVAPSLKTTTI